MIKIISYDDAKAKGLKFYFTGKPCRHGHVLGRYISNKHCVICERASAKKWHKDNPKHANVSYKKWREKNLERDHANNKKWREKNPLYSKRHYKENYVRHYTSVRKWQRANSDKVAAFGAQYRASKLNAKPGWLTLQQTKQITAIYAEAQNLTRETGVQHHVDHRVPLRAKRRGSLKQIACGLHVPWNLRVIPGAENNSKHCYIDDLLLSDLVGPSGRPG